jgi:UDP-GlcNAc:undecaprenyl-phosphate GlcNAc-1-phosphate transferase
MSADAYALGAAVLMASLALSAGSMPLAFALARRFAVIDQPGRRKVHANPTPRTGGVAVAIGFLAVVGAGFFIAPRLTELPEVAGTLPLATLILRDAHKVAPQLLALLAGSALAFAVGLADDFWGGSFPVWAKAGGQLAAAVILVAAGVRTSFLPYEWMNIGVTLLWLFGMINAFNLLDNMDGLCAGVAAVASLALLVNAWLLGEFFISLLLLAFIGSLLGFLFFNWHPARIFLGDGGSHLVGYVMGSLTLLERYVSHASSTLFPLLMPVLVLAVPLLDTLTVMVIRLREGRPIYVGDDRHLSHHLRTLGFSTRRAVALLYLLTFSLGLGAASLTDATLTQAVLVLMQSAGVVGIVLMLMFTTRPPRERPPG